MNLYLNPNKVTEIFVKVQMLIRNMEKQFLISHLIITKMYQLTLYKSESYKDQF